MTKWRQALSNLQSSKIAVIVATSTLLTLSFAPFANAESTSNTSHTAQFGSLFLALGVFLLAAIISNVAERFGQPPVVGQLLAGVVLSALGYFGWDLMREAARSDILGFIANFGAIILLLSAGMESRVRSLAKVGLYASVVAIIGVALPFLFGTYMLGPLFFPNESSNTYLFIGASLVATSVGISVAVFRALGIAKTRAAQTVLAAAIFDDIIGLVILGVASELVTTGSIGPQGVAILVAKSLGFLLAALLVGRLVTRHISRAMAKLSGSASTKLVVAISLALLLAYIADLVGMEPIIGAFAAGLLLEGMVYKDYAEPDVVEDLIHLKNTSTSADKRRINFLIAKHRRDHLGGMVEALGVIVVPVFFVYTGLQIDFGSLLHVHIYVIAIIMATVAIIGKIIAGFAAQGGLREKLIVGLSMVPRGEVGLIFAATAKNLGVFDEVVYSTLVLVIMLTTFVAPPVLVRLIRQHTAK